MIFLELKKAIDLEKYNEYSEFVTTKLNEIFKELIATGQNQIILNTNLKAGLPMENINKIAGPIMEAWAQEKLLDIVGNDFNFIRREAKLMGQTASELMIHRIAFPSEPVQNVFLESEIVIRKL